jgi:hypothetical protein
MNEQNDIKISHELEPLKQYSVILIKGKKKIFINNRFSGEDKRKEAADVILGNRKF